MQLTLNTVETNVIAAQMAGQSGPLPQTLKNRKSALRQAAKLLGMRDTDPANLLLGPNLESTIVVIRGQGLSKKATSDLISHLRWWDSQTTVRFPVAAAAAANAGKRDTHIDRKFKNFLRHHIKERGLSWEAVAEQSGIPLPTIYGWLKGVRPERTAHASLDALAKVLHVSLADLMQFARKRMNHDVRGKPTEYGKYLLECRTLKFNLKESDTSEALRQEWFDFLAHQTKRSPFKRAQHTGWKQEEWPANRRRQPAWYETFGGKYLPSANAFWRRMQQFLGWLSVPLHQGGFGLELSQCQTLAWLAQPQAVEAFVAWSEARAGNVTNTGVRNFRQCVHALTAKEVGWLRQQPTKRASLPVAYQGESWDSLCDACLDFCEEHSERNVELSRDPLRSIERLRKLDDPCGPVFDAVAQLLIEAESFNDDSLASAIAYRDAALLAFLVLVPLRAKNVKALTVGSSRKNVWFEGDHMYVSISSKLLKNGKRLGNLEIDGVSSELTDAIRRYIEIGRPRLVRNSTTDLLFVGSHDPNVMWDTVSPRVCQLTRRFLAEWVPDGLPIHTFRHLVATRFLQLYPGDYVGAAALLHDRLQTVLKTYAPKDPTGAIKKNAQRAHLRGPH